MRRSARRMPWQWAAIPASLGLASGLHAAADPAPSAQPAFPCELHIFPTTEIIDASPEYGKAVGAEHSLVAGALTALQSSGSGKLRAPAVQQMQVILSPEAQVRELSAAGVASILKLPDGTKIVAEPVLPAPFGDPPADPVQRQAYQDYWHAMKKGTPLRPATGSCYRELIVSSISIAKGLGSLKFSSAFVYRVFGDDHREVRLSDGENSILKPQDFPAMSEDKAPEANAALRAAFVRNFTEWVGRRVHPLVVRF